MNDAPWDVHRDVVVYRDDRYALGQRGGGAYLTADGKTYALSCHPYEPCLYIEDGRGMTAVHNAFDPFVVLERFADGETVVSICGTEYDAPDFCKMVEYAAGKGDLSIDDAEKVFGDREKKKTPAPKPHETPCAPRPEGGRVIEDDPVCGLLAQYPDSAVDWCLVANGQRAPGRDAHFYALAGACRRLFYEENGEPIWASDVTRANAKPMRADALFAPARQDGALNYRTAFLHPPYGSVYREADFDRINDALFPNGKDALEVFEWTTDWSEYFDEGHEWWGTLCLTVYDKTLDRFVVILASATD